MIPITVMSWCHLGSNEYINLLVKQSFNTEMECITPPTLIKSDSSVCHKTNEDGAINTTRFHCDKNCGVWMWRAERKDDKLFRCEKRKETQTWNRERESFYLFQHGYVIKKQWSRQDMCPLCCQEGDSLCRINLAIHVRTLGSTLGSSLLSQTLEKKNFSRVRHKHSKW